MAGEVGIKIKVSAKDATRNLSKLKNLSNRLQESFNRLKNRSNGAANNIRKTGIAAKTASKGVNALNRAVRNLVIGFSVLQTGRFVIFQTAELEKQTKALTVLTGSAATAQKIVQEIKEFGAVTPFKSSELIEVAKRMKAFGFETEKVVDITKRIADVAGTAGADINNVALAIGKVQAKNKFMQEENVMLLEKGINVTKELEKIMGMNGETLAKAMSKGEVGADKFVQALINLTSEGGEFFGGASAQSDTLAGKFSTLVDNIETLSQRIGEKLEPVLKSALDTAIALVTRINQAIAAGSITDRDKKALRQQALGIVEEQTTPLQRSMFGMGEVSVDFQGQEFKGQPAGVTSQITNALINAEVAKRMKEQLDLQAKLADAGNKTLKTTKDKNNELNKSLNTTNQLTTANTQLNEKLEKQRQTQQEITNILASGMTNAVMGLIEGTKTLGQALADIAKQLASMFLNKAFSSIFSNMFGGGVSGVGPVASGSAYAGMLGGAVGLYSSAGSFKAFRQGGIVTSPTMGIIGEGGEPEYVIPASKMSGAMSRYSAGARGGSVIPGGSGDSGTVAGSSGNTVVEYTGPVLNFNGDEYVPKSAVPEIIGAATKQGAMAGKAQTINALRNSRSQRASLGL